MGQACGAYKWGEGVYRVLVGKPEGKRPLGRPRRRRVDNIRMDIQEVGCGYMDWIGLAQDRDRWRTLESAVMSLRVPWNVGNFLTSCRPVSFSRRTLHHGVSKSVSKEYIQRKPPPPQGCSSEYQTLTESIYVEGQQNLAVSVTISLETILFKKTWSSDIWNRQYKSSQNILSYNMYSSQGS